MRNRSRILFEQVDANVSGGAPAPDPRDREIAALKDRVAAQDKADKEIAEKLAASERDKIAKDRDQSKAALEAKDKEIAELRAKTEANEKKEAERYDALFADLPETSRGRIGKYKAELSADTYRKMIQDEHEEMLKSKDVAPAIYGSSGSSSGNRGAISPQAKEVLAQMTGNYDRVVSLMEKTKQRDEKTGITSEVFGVPLVPFLKNLNVLQGRSLNSRDAVKGK